MFLIRHVLRLSCLNGLNSPKHKQHTYTVQPYIHTHTHHMPRSLWPVWSSCHSYSDAYPNPITELLAYVRDRNQTSTRQDLNQWINFVYLRFIVFFFCLAGIDLSVIWAAVVTLTTKSAVCLCWCAVNPAAAVSFVAAKLKECSSRLPHILPLATCAGSPAHSTVCLHAHKHPIINNDLKPHSICCMKDVDFIGKTQIFWVMTLWWSRPCTITHIDGIHFICKENTSNVTHKNGPQVWPSKRPWKKPGVLQKQAQQQVDECMDCHRKQQSTTSGMGPADTRVCTENQNLKLPFWTYSNCSNHGILHLDEGTERALFNAVTVSPYRSVSSGTAAP